MESVPGQIKKQERDQSLGPITRTRTGPGPDPRTFSGQETREHQSIGMFPVNTQSTIH